MQDDIPPFSTDEALAMMEADLKVPPSSVFVGLSKEPVAAASLGQVYKAALATTGVRHSIRWFCSGVAQFMACFSRPGAHGAGNGSAPHQTSSAFLCRVVKDVMLPLQVSR